MEVNIVPLSKNHIKSVAEIEKECFSDPWSEASISAELSKDDSVFLVAILDENVVGYCGMNFVLDEGYIANIAVTSFARKNGIATLLLNEIIAKARELSLSFVSLEVRSSNKNAISLYQKLGFQDAGIRKNYYSKPTEDGNIMTLYL